VTPVEELDESVSTPTQPSKKDEVKPKKDEVKPKKDEVKPEEEPQWPKIEPEAHHPSVAEALEKEADSLGGLLSHIHLGKLGDNLLQVSEDAPEEDAPEGDEETTLYDRQQELYDELMQMKDEE
jgi:hypothetical protein